MNFGGDVHGRPQPRGLAAQLGEPALPETSSFSPATPDTDRDTAELAPVNELSALRARVLELEADQALLEEQVRQLHRAKTISDLVAGVAHDLSGALTGILWCTEALRRRVAGLDTDLSTGLSDFVSAADYARRLARRLISIGRPRDAGPTRVFLQETMSDALSLLDSLRPANVHLSAHLALPDTCVWGNADELQQVLVNLATNAFDAVSVDGGEVRVELRLADEPGAAWALLRVEDTGHGMPPETLRRAFEPFFTTKGARDGNGLGLVVVQSIVQHHGGKLIATSTTGVGTTMDVLLPLANNEDASFDGSNVPSMV